MASSGARRRAGTVPVLLPSAGVVRDDVAVGTPRLESLDAFRGMTVAAMILVNNPGNWEYTYAPLQHAPWNGYTAADLIFPFFLLIVGVAITFSLGEARPGTASVQAVYRKVIRRTCTIFALGVFLNGFPLFDWSTLRIPGVLQRIALCYGLASVVALRTGVGTQAVLVGALLSGYAALTTIGASAAHAVGVFGPDENLGAHLDRALLHHHLLHDDWDPEGIAGTFPALATALCGVLAGHWLRWQSSAAARVGGLCTAGALGVGLGLFLNRWIPINKNLWTSSYVVFTAGVALIVLALFYWIVDVRAYRRWARPFVIYGSNAIVAYVLSTLMGKLLLLAKVRLPDGSKIDLQRYVFDHVFLPHAAPLNASLLYAVSYVLLWLGITAFLYRQRIIIKI